MKRLYLKPVAGRACPDPAQGGALLPDEGADVPHTVYWQRRLDAGDAVKAEKPKAKPVKAEVAVTAGGEQ
ncbi:hypothetical protein AUC61_23920 [Pseudomonas sp. S25]|uniref:DUF2635 domain-containing protein n=1 Tax=Pseudomonas maioricensis TaxID=1766623 RepID=A0ABS9ZRQ7_9PSED|nr:hypothetical protein [Pseudomonas sp. S25]